MRKTYDRLLPKAVRIKLEIKNWGGLKDQTRYVELLVINKTVLYPGYKDIIASAKVIETVL